MAIEIENYAEYKIEEFKIESGFDGSLEPSLFCAAEGEEKRPLLVSLHSWSFGRHNQVNTIYPLAKKHNWHVLWPEFRGSNKMDNPKCREACASITARQDIIDAVEYVCANYNVDTENILLIGGSGGGHMAMMMTAYRPEVWKSVAAFCGITDLVKWHSQNSNYAVQMEACCGGKPEGEALKEYQDRSPINYAEEIAKVNELYIYHGKFDKAVPVTHGVEMYEKIYDIAPESKVFLNIFDGPHRQVVEFAEEQFVRCLNSEDQGITITG